MFPRKTDDVTVVLPEPPGANLRDGGPTVVAQITGLANQGQARDVCELCGLVPRAARDCLPGRGELLELVTAGKRPAFLLASRLARVAGELFLGRPNT